MSEEKQRYHSFLLRLWQVKEDEHTAWRASLESSHTGERWGFAGLDAVCAFLRRWISEGSGSSGETEAETQAGRSVTEPTVQPRQSK